MHHSFFQLIRFKRTVIHHDATTEVYVKACEIVVSNKTTIFVRLGDFNWLKSFFGPTGSSMKGSAQEP